MTFVHGEVGANLISAPAQTSLAKSMELEVKLRAPHEDILAFSTRKVNLQCLY